MANRSNIMGLHGLKNRVSKNVFDLSHRNLFTAKVGELLPCFVQELNPGDSIKLDSSYFTRTAPLNTAAFTRLRENVQYFFVPYSQLWKYFPSQVINMTKNANGGDISRIASGITDNMKVSTQMPVVNYSSLHQYLLALINKKSPADEGALFNHGCYRHAESAKLLQLLGYGNFKEQFAQFNDGVSAENQWKLPSFTHAPYLSVFRLLAYQKICNDHYTYRQWQPYNASLCNVDYITPNSGNYLDMSSMVVGLADSVQKQNFLDMRFSNLPLDYFNGVLPTAQFGDESVVNLNLGNVSGSVTLDGSTGNPDYSYSDTNFSVLHGSHDGAIFGSSNYYETDSNGAFMAGREGPSGNKDYVQFSTPHTHSLSGTTSVSTSLNGSLNIIALRNAIAQQRYKEIQLANDVDFASQVEAHFGIKPKKDDSTSIFIGGSSSMIDINPVVNQNLSSGPNTDASAVTKAAPTGSGQSHFKFTADTYGVVIGIYRCTPVLDYEHAGIDRTLLKSDASDFVIPELDSVGMQQTFRCEVVAPSAYNPTYPNLITDTWDLSETYGFAPRFAEYKVSYDRYNGAFCGPLKSWVTGLNFDDLSRRYYSLSLAINAPALFTCRPDIVKNIFGITQYHTSNDDNLYVGMVNMCSAVRGLSKYGLPYSH